MKSLFLENVHRAAGASFRPYEGWSVPSNFGDMVGEFRCLVESVGLVDFGFLTVVRVSGADRADYLNRRLSQLILGMNEGEGRRATLLDATGKMLADVDVFADGETLVVLSLPRENDRVAFELEKYVFSEDCRFEDVTDQYGIIGLVGPIAGTIIKGLRVESLSGDQRLARRTVDGRDVYLLRSEYVPGGLLLMAAVDNIVSLAEKITGLVRNAGGCLVGLDAFDTWRTVNGFPWWGRDLDNNTIPLEADLLRAIHFDKGCYPGQETIAVITNLGHPSRKLVRTRSTGGPLPAGAKLLTVDGKTAGAVTSSARHPLEDAVYSLAMVKWQYRAEGTELRHETTEVKIIGPCAHGG